jgi:exonuclease III
MASASLAPRIKRAWIDNDAAGSDHQPIWTEIEL